MAEPRTESTPEPTRRELIVGLGLPALLLLAMIAPAGLWDPYELNAADLARRAAVHVLGGSGLALPGADNRLPTLGDVGHNELPTMSVAVAFRLFGLGAPAGRLPMALWAIAGLGALWWLLRRLAGARAASCAAWVLVTTPLYFVQARTMLGDAVTMSAQLLALAGLAVALLDPLAPRRTRAAAWLLGALGLAAGFFCRGALLGVAVPALAVGATWALAAANEDGPHAPRWASPAGAAAASLLVAGLTAVELSLDALARATPTQFHRALGSAVAAAQRYPTFDAVLAHLGPALFPWSALVPLALGRLLIGHPAAADPAATRPPASDARASDPAATLSPASDPAASEPAAAGPATTGEAQSGSSIQADTTLTDPALAAVRQARLRALVLVGLALAYLAHGWLAARTGVVPFASVGLVAAAAGLTLSDLERGAHPSRALVVVAGLLGALWMLDIRRAPERAMAVFALPLASPPESFRGPGEAAVTAATAVFVALLALAMLPGEPPPPGALGGLPALRRWTGVDDARAVLRELNALWQGNLTFVAVMVEAMLAGLGALLFAAPRLGWRLALTASLPASVQSALGHAWWAVPVGALGGLLGALTARRASALLLARTGWPRARLAAAAGVGAGLVMSLFYYPALAEQLSPRHVFDAFARLRGGREPIGLLGVAGRSAAYYTRAESRSLPDATAAFGWLMAGPERRWLAVRADELPRLNSLYRALGPAALTPDHNLPVLDARSSQLLLVSSAPGGQPDQNPLAALVSSLPPRPQVPRAASLDDTLESLGWSLHEGDDGALAPHVIPGRPYVLRFYWRVLATPATSWRSFIHIDGFGRRHNGDHDVLGGRYPMSLWQPGDIVTDRYELRLEPNFTPGNYQLYYGFFSGERRLPVRSGPHVDNRVDGGAFPVR